MGGGGVKKLCGSDEGRVKEIQRCLIWDDKNHSLICLNLRSPSVNNDGPLMTSQHVMFLGQYSTYSTW